MSYTNNSNFIKAVRYIYKHIDQTITLEDIAKEVGISVSSLKRLFIDIMNKSPGAFIRRLRMELAFRSLVSRDDSILEIALNSGFDDQSAFARSFKDTFGYSPTVARKKLNIVNEFEHIALNEPDIIELNALPIQAVTKQGLYYECAPQAWAALKNKLIATELSDDFSGMFIGIGHDNPHSGLVAEDKVRYSAGVTLINRDLGIDHLIIPGGTYARFYYTGKPMNLGMAYHYIYGRWNEESQQKINQSIPAFMVYDNFPVALKEHKIIIHVPLIEC